MEELTVKKDFTDIYSKTSPISYLKEMRTLEYRIPDQTKPLYEHLADRLYNNFQRPIKILDMGSSYGINSALLSYELIMAELDDFFLENDKEPTIQEAHNFFDEITERNPCYEFYLIDSSKPALKFADHVGLCNDTYCVNLEEEKCPSELKATLKDIDMIISTGCVGYIGYRSFAKLFESINSKKAPCPLFAFSVLRIFSMDNIQKTFQKNRFSLLKSKIGPLKQRRFYNRKEMTNAVSLLKEMGISTDGLEEKGYFFADFYVGGPTNQVDIWISWLDSMEDVFAPINGSEKVLKDITS